MSVHSLAQVPAQPWGAVRKSCPVGEYLRSQALEVRITGVPHAGIAPDVALADALERAGDRVVVAELRGGVSASDAVLPHQLSCWVRNWDMPQR